MIDELNNAMLETPMDLDELDLSDPPEFSFLGTDGEYYIVGKSPRAFEDEVIEVMKQYGTLGADQTNISFWIELWDRWIWLHVSSVPEQRHLSLDDAKRLYFVEDRPDIIHHIFQRFLKAQQATYRTFNIVADSTQELRLALEAFNNAGEASTDAGGRSNIVPASLDDPKN